MTAVLTLSVAAEAASSSPTNALARLEPAEGCYVGVCLGSGDTIESFSFRMGWRPAVSCGFFDFPLTAESRRQVTEFLSEVRRARGIALVTLQPNTGLNNVTDESCVDFVQFCADQEGQGSRGILVRFGHEMNGNWYAWGQQPIAYKEKFRMLAEKVHARTTRTAMMWAPAYGGGYPFKADQLQPGPLDFSDLDTDGDGRLTENDDCYEPYYPGDDAVDWVGLTVYHWGTQYPWLKNEVPEPNSFAQFVTGEYVGGNGDQTAVPDFYARYCSGNPHTKPLAIPETAAFFNPQQGGASEVDIKRAWFEQVLNIHGDRPDAVDVARHFPRLKCVSWFDQYKLESETGQWIDWRVSEYDPVREAFLGAIRGLRNGRPWFLGAENIEGLQQDYAITLHRIPAILPPTGAFPVSVFVSAHAACDLHIDLVDAQSATRAEARQRIRAGQQRITLPVAMKAPLIDGALYHYHGYLTPINSDSGQVLADSQGVPRAARRIDPHIQIEAAPAVLTPGANTVRVRYSSDKPAVAVVNLVDSGYHWQGGGSLKVDGGDRFQDIQVTVPRAIRNGRYILESFLSDPSTNLQVPMAQGQNVVIDLRGDSDRDAIRAVVEFAMIRAGEVFRFVVEYAASTNRDLHIDLFDAHTNFLAGALQPVAAGTGIRDMTLSSPTAPPGDYFIRAFITPTGGTWTDAVAWSPEQAIELLPGDYCDWLQAHWGVLLSTDLIGPHDDPDGDGIPNMTEFHAGTDPRRPDILPARAAREGAGCLVAWPSVLGQRYQLLQTADAERGPWTPIGEPISGTGSTLETVVDRTGGARFFRVQAVPDRPR